MSWKGSLHYWSLGPFDFHIFAHALDPKQRRFYVLGTRKHEYQVWPPKHILDYTNEWTQCSAE